MNGSEEADTSSGTNRPMQDRSSFNAESQIAKLYRPGARICKGAHIGSALPQRMEEYCFRDAVPAFQRLLA